MSTTTAQAWAAVHPWREAATLLVTVGSASAALSQAHIAGLGPLRFVSPVSLLLMLPAVAGTAVGLACAKQTGPLPDPPRAKAARLAWLLGWIVLAALVSNAGHLTGADVDALAVVRNVGLHVALALSAVTVGSAAHAWLPPVLLSLATTLFGAGVDADERFWWAVLLEPTATTAQGTVVGALLGVVALGYVRRGARPTGLA